MSESHQKQHAGESDSNTLDIVFSGTQYKLNVLNIFQERKRLQNTRPQKHIILKRGDES